MMSDPQEPFWAASRVWPVTLRSAKVSIPPSSGLFRASLGAIWRLRGCKPSHRSFSCFLQLATASNNAPVFFQSRVLWFLSGVPPRKTRRHLSDVHVAFEKRKNKQKAPEESGFRTPLCGWGDKQNTCDSTDPPKHEVVYAPRFVLLLFSLHSCQAHSPWHF